MTYKEELLQALMNKKEEFVQGLSGIKNPEVEWACRWYIEGLKTSIIIARAIPEVRDNA